MEERNRICKRATLCWLCQNARADRCTWFIDFTPVDGWNAIPTTLNVHDGNSIRIESSFIVIKCPKFTPEKSKINCVKVCGIDYSINLSHEIERLGNSQKPIKISSLKSSAPEEIRAKIARVWLQKSGFSGVLKISEKNNDLFIEWKKMV